MPEYNGNQPDKLPAPLLETLLLAVAPCSPTDERGHALRARVLAQARTPLAVASDSLTMRAGQGQWLPLTPLAEMKLLHEDASGRSFLLRLLPGARLPAHDHIGDEECLVLEGEGYIGELFLRAGDYAFANEHVHHGETYTATGALVYMRTATTAACA